jgi:hypothetical protein
MSDPVQAHWYNALKYFNNIQTLSGLGLYKVCWWFSLRLK